MDLETEKVIAKKEGMLMGVATMLPNAASRYSSPWVTPSRECGLSLAARPELKEYGKREGG